MESAHPETLPDLLNDVDCFSREQILTLLGISDPTLSNREAKGDAPPSYKVGRRKLYPKTQFKAWMSVRRKERKL